MATTSTINGSSLMSKLSAGSGVDTKTLAENLVDAERQPQKALLDKKIQQSTAKVSGYAAVNFVLGQVKDAFAALNDKSDFASLKVDNSKPAAFSVTADATAEAGVHDVKVTSLVSAQRSLLGGFAAPNTAVTTPYTLTLTAGGTPKSVSIDAGATPLTIVTQLNTLGAEFGITAKLINTGAASNPYKIVMTGAVGSANSFTVSTDDGTGTAVANMGFSTIQAASDAVATIDGITYTRTTNKLTGIVKGLTFDLSAPTAAAESATVNLTRDTTALTDKVSALVTSYNDAVSMFNVVTDSASKVETYGATLVNDSTVRTVRNQLRSLFTGTSSTPGTSISQMWQIGVSINRDGIMELDKDKLSAALSSNYDDVVTMMTGNLNNQSALGSRPGGIGGDAVRNLTALTSPTGLVATQSKGATEQETKYKKDLEKLETRLGILLTRYTKQFAAMDSLVGQVNSTKTSLKSTFDGMAKAYGS